jgi:hypothetical protein
MKNGEAWNPGLAVLGILLGAGCSDTSTPAGTSFLRVTLLAGKAPVGAVRVDITRVDDPGSIQTYCFKTVEDEALPEGEVAVSFGLSRDAGEDLSRLIEITVTPYESLAGSRGFVSCPTDFSALSPVFPPRSITVGFCGDGTGPREVLFHLSAPACPCQNESNSSGDCCDVGQSCGAGISSDPSSSCKPGQCCLAIINDICAQPVIK